MSAAPFVIVGGGLAAASAVRTLREDGYDGELVVMTTEPFLPYERPPLSKDYLRGEVDRTAVFPLDDSWYTEHAVEVITMATAVRLDVGDHRIGLADGRTLAYTKLLLATGSTPRPLPVAGADLRGVLSLRTLADADLLGAALSASAHGGRGRVAIVGDGWIGMEVAASARTLGLEVDVLGHGATPLAKVLGHKMGEMYAQLHIDHGVRLHRRAEVAAVTGEEGRVTGVQMADGTTVDADIVLAAVGAAPNVGLAASAGLQLRPADAGGGVAVTGTLCTTDPDVFAAGDIASVPSPHFGRPLRVEHWETALHTGPHAARAMMGSSAAYDTLPYFYSDQYDAGMEYTGYVAPAVEHEVVVSGSLETREFVAFWTADGYVNAVMAVNTWDRMDEAKSLIRSGRRIPLQELEAFRT